MAHLHSKVTQNELPNSSLHDLRSTVCADHWGQEYEPIIASHVNLLTSWRAGIRDGSAACASITRPPRHPRSGLFEALAILGAHLRLAAQWRSAVGHARRASRRGDALPARAPRCDSAAGGVRAADPATSPRTAAGGGARPADVASWLRPLVARWGRKRVEPLKPQDESLPV